MVKTTAEGDGQYLREEMHKAITNDLKHSIRVRGASKIARYVDEQPLVNAQLSLYGQYRRNLSRNKELDDNVQKARSKYGSGYGVGEFSLSQSFEEIFFNYYGCDYYGRPFPPKIGEGYTCPGCGLKMLTSMKTVNPNCPVCGRITPLGMAIRDGIYKR